MHHEASESLDFATSAGNDRTSVDVADDKKIIITQQDLGYLSGAGRFLKKSYNPTASSDKRYDAIAQLINAEVQQQTDISLGWNANIYPDIDLSRNVEAVTGEQVEEMIAEWIVQTLIAEFPNVNLNLFDTDPAFSEIPKQLEDYFLDVAFDANKYNESYKSQYVDAIQKGDYRSVDNIRILDAARRVAEKNSKSVLASDVEPTVGAYITQDQKIGRFLLQLELMTGDNTIVKTFSENPQVRGLIKESWPAIAREINSLEANKINPSFHVGASKLAADVVDDTNDNRWIATLFTDTPMTKEQYKLQKDIARLDEDFIKALVANPKKEFSDKYLPSDEVLKDRYGQWAVDAKKLYVAQFDDRVQATRLNTPNRDSQTIATETLNFINDANEGFGGFLAEQENKYLDGIEEANYNNLVSQFETFSKAKSAITNWLGGRQVSQNFQDRLANHLTDPRMIDLIKDSNAQNTGQAIESLIQNVLSPMANQSPEQLLSDAQDFHTLSNMTLDTSNTEGARGARQRQGFAYTPQGQLKPYTAERNVIDPDTGERKRIRESGAQLMANLHLYPELVQRTILYGINRPQQEITSYQDIGITPLPPAFFEGIEGQGRYFGDVPMHGGTFAFDKNYIATPDLTPQFDFSYNMRPPDDPPIPDKIEIPEIAPAIPPLPKMRNPNLDSQFGG